MFTRTAVVASIATIAIGLVPNAARAQQTLNFTAGYFSVRGEDGRDTTDILVNDRRYLTFDVADVSSGTIGGEWLVPIGRFIEGGAGVSLSRGTTSSQYTGFSTPGGNAITQELRLRQVPIAFTLRALPLGQSSPIQPYFGGGLAVINWHYSESGDFVDFSNSNTIFHDSFVGSGWQTAPVALGGIRFAGNSASAGFEVRYQHAKADLPQSEFASTVNPNPTVDLGGWTYQGTVGIRFGK
jgi:hypothetical protein